MGLVLSNPTHGDPNLAGGAANNRTILPWSGLPADRVNSGAVRKKSKNRMIDESTQSVFVHIHQQFDLPAELLGELLDRLSPADRVRFSAVCKSWWRSVREHKNQIFDVLPWSVSYEMEMRSTSEPIVCVCKLFDTMHQRPYSVHEVCSEDKFSLCNTTVRGLNHGWLIFSWESRTDITSFLLFSPFTREIISLPELDYIVDDNARILSSQEPSRESDFFILHCDLRRIIIRTCKSGDMEWKATQFGLNNSVHNAVCYNGLLYCVDDRGYVRAYDMINKTRISLVDRAIITRNLGNCKFDLVVCNGKLLFVQWEKVGGDRDLFRVFERTTVFRVFELTTKWVEKKSLGDQVLVLSSPSFSVGAFGSTRNMANRIYYKSYNSVLGCNELKYFSLADGKCHKCEESVYSSSWLEEGRWVQPPQFHN